MPDPCKTMHGWLILDKPKGLSSARAVAHVKKTLMARKAGHAGTLDPLASGVLPIAIGEATKTTQLTMDCDKQYLFSIDWGLSTTTLDADGEIIARSAKIPQAGQIKQTLNKFIGNILQRPPDHSAIKINGKRAYKLARAGTRLNLPERPVTLFEAEMVETLKPNTTRFRIRCSKGFYVRALARDLAQQLKTQGHVSSLVRTHVGSFSLQNAKTLEMIDRMRNNDQIKDCLIPIPAALEGIDVIETSGHDSSSLKHGRHIAVGNAQIRCGSKPQGQNSNTERIALAVHSSTPIALGYIRDGQFYPSRVFGIT